jgi:hypothetical protein
MSEQDRDVGNGMMLSRWREVMNDESKQLTSEEKEAGWHFCGEFDGLLVGPAEDAEWDCCTCFTQEEKDAFLAKAKSNES